MGIEDGKYSDLVIARYEHWTTFLHEKQAYLGRSYIALNREAEEDYLDPYRDTTPAEKYELDVAVNGIYVALKKLHQPTKFDYTNFGNEWKHCHLHVIPRYASFRTVNDTVFQDLNWGGNYSPYDKEFNVPAETFEMIKQGLRSELRTF